MSPSPHVTSVADAGAQVRSLARPLRNPTDLDPLVDQVGAARFVCLGEASHGTHEFYRWRALLSRRLIVERGFTWVGVEGDWPDCWRINRWVRGPPERSMLVPEVRAGSHEDLLHHALGQPAVLPFGADRSGPWLSARLGHRAIGVVYQPVRESGDYVPTRMGERYDALIWLEQTTALTPLHHEARPVEPELETEPSGF